MLQPKQYRKKPVVIEAQRFDPFEIPPFGLAIVMEAPCVLFPSAPHAVVKTLEGDLFACPGDWIIKGIKGELYPCKPDVFDATYEEV